jgi:hypothetical protein
MSATHGEMAFFPNSIMLFPIGTEWQSRSGTTGLLWGTPVAETPEERPPEEEVPAGMSALAEGRLAMSRAIAIAANARKVVTSFWPEDRSDPPQILRGVWEELVNIITAEDRD